MSSGMNEREIDDVLKSVRRLVAQEERQSGLPPLVLTPEMRVEDGADAAGAPDAGGGTDAEAGTNAEGGTDAKVETEGAEAQSDRPDDPPSPPSDSTLPARHAPPPPPAIPDDAALQEMVAQIVRDELSGKLGEKITLAVRKLVRNEIARAMDEQRRK